MDNKSLHSLTIEDAIKVLANSGSLVASNGDARAKIEEDIEAGFPCDEGKISIVEYMSWMCGGNA